jgi:hypothetical protein
MKSKSPSASPDPDRPQPIASPVEDMRRLKRNSTASVAELRHFLRQMRGKSPREMLGIVAASNLARHLAAATKWTILTILVFTAVPFAWSKLFGEKKPPAPAVRAAAATAASSEAPQAATSQPAAPSSAAKPDSSAVAPKTAEKLGIGEEKSAPPNVNPLDSPKDDLFKDLK